MIGRFQNLLELGGIYFRVYLRRFVDEHVYDAVISHPRPGIFSAIVANILERIAGQCRFIGHLPRGEEQRVRARPPFVMIAEIQIRLLRLVKAQIGTRGRIGLVVILGLHRQY